VIDLGEVTDSPAPADEFIPHHRENFNFGISSPVRTNNIAGEAATMYSFFITENDE
jgi:hypothetical protein